MEQNSRDYRFDLLRVIAALLIVLRHSPIAGSASGIIMTGISYFTEPGVCLFFMISGAFLLNNELTTDVFLKRRFIKVLFPTLFWTIFYLTVNYIQAPQPLTELIKNLLSIPFSVQGHGVLWFMYTLSGLYLLTPILSKWVKSASKMELEFYLLLWVITLFYPYLSRMLMINDSHTGILYYFTGYAGYFLLGYYLKNYYKYRHIDVVIAILIAVIIPAALYSSQIQFDYYVMLDYLTLPVAAMSFCWFVMISSIKNNSNAIISKVARMSFGIYLVHIFILHNIIWEINDLAKLPSLVQILAICVLTFVFSFVVTWLISRLPFSKYIIGV